MSEIPIQLAVEDLLSEIVLRTLLDRSKKEYCVGTVFNHGGFGYLRKTAPGFNNAARGTPFLLLTDLDKHNCPTALVTDWLTQPKHPNFLFRIAVREVEAWILADARNFGKFLGISSTIFPAQPEILEDAKETLVSLAARSRRTATRSRIVPKPGSTAKQGPDYNQCLGEFVIRHWDHMEASKYAPSLLRCIRAIETFRPTWQTTE
ncbi:MAG: hypothetical protein ABSA39_10520 [Edaphobacter sp.]